MPRVLKKPWLESFIDYISNADVQIPADFIPWTGISLLGTSLKGNVYTYYRNIKFFPNQYIVLIAPPGIGKGSAMRPAIDIAKEAGTVNYIEDKITPEKLISVLADGFLKSVKNPSGAGNPLTLDHTGCVVATELANFLATSDWMHGLLCDLWDRRDYTYDTKNKGQHKINDLCFSLLAGCTPDYIRSLIREKVAHVTGGFTARTLFIYASEVRQLATRAFGKPTGVTSQLLSDLTNDLQHISSLTGEIEFTDEAQDYWQTKYIEHNTPSNGSYYSDAHANFRSRISSHILKTALAITVSENDTLQVTKNQLEYATKLVEKVRNTVDIVFKYTGERPIEVAMEKIADFIRTKGLYTSRAEILRHNRFVTDEELTTILKTLELAGRIRQDTDDKGRIVFLPTTIC